MISHRISLYNKLDGIIMDYNEDIIVLNVKEETKKHYSASIGMGCFDIGIGIFLLLFDGATALKYLLNHVYFSVFVLFLALVVIYELLVIHFIEKNRIIYLTKDGIITKLFFYKKQFSWDKYVVKKYAEDEFIYFSRKKKLKRKKYFLDFYADYHPLSCVRILLLTRDYDIENYLCDILVNAVDETHFKKKMKEWNIEIENYDLS